MTSGWTVSVQRLGAPGLPRSPRAITVVEAHQLAPSPLSSAGSTSAIERPVGHRESVGAVVDDVTLHAVGVAQHEEVVAVPQDDRVAVDVVGGDAAVAERVAVPREQRELTRLDDDRRQHDVVVDLVADRPPLEVGGFVAAVVELDPLAARVVGAVRVDHQLVDDHVGPAIGADIGRPSNAASAAPANMPETTTNPYTARNRMTVLSDAFSLSRNQALLNPHPTPPTASREVSAPSGRRNFTSSWGA